MSYTIVKIKSSYNETITSLLKELIGFSIEVIEKPDYILYKHNYENIKDIENVILTLSSELMINIFGYQTITANPDEELKIVEKSFKNYVNGFYTLKSLLFTEMNSFDKKELLDLLLAGSGITKEFIKEYIKYDLNISKASKEMFIHRNTMNYKLDKLKELSGFDLRSFKDAYILYSLIINK